MKKIINYAITLVLWIFAIVLWANGTFPYLCWFLIALHFIELIAIGYRTGREYGINTGKRIIMCMLFGFFWWLPLRKQMKDETFTDVDFIREG